MRTAINYNIKYLTSTGYRDSLGTHIYVRDWQGNVRAVVSRDGGSTVFDQTTYYYPYGLPMAESTSPQANPYKYTAKELITDQALNLADHGARMYDPAIARWLSADPKSRDFTSTSHYLFCAGNPLNYIDLDGEIPSPYEAALMCSAVYRDKDTYSSDIAKLKDCDWFISSFNTSIQKNHPAQTGIGVQSMLFERTIDGVTEYAYAYAGTNSWEDAVEDVTQLIGVSAEYDKAIKNARILSEEIGDAELTFVGHSMGGGNSTAGSMATGRAAITFNSAAVSSFTQLFYNLGSANNVTNYIISAPKSSFWIGDPVNFIQNCIGVRPPGVTITIPLNINPIKAHKVENFVEYFKPNK